MKKKNVQLRVLLLVGLGVMIGACGGGGGSGSPATNPGIVGGGGSGGGGAAPGSRSTGTLSVSFSDAPISDQFSNALLGIREVRLIATDPNEAEVAVILPEALEIDLLQLASFPETLFTFSVPVDARYYAVNVLVDSLTLVRADGSRISVLLPEFDSVREGMVLTATMSDDFSGGTLPSFGVGPSNQMGRIIMNVEIPLDMTVHENGGKYSFSPLALVTYPFDMQFRVEGTVSEVIASDVVHPNGAFTLCNLRNASNSMLAWDPTERCVLVSVRSSTAFLGADASSAPNGFGDLVIDENVVVYGDYDIYKEGHPGLDGFVAKVVARGTEFERVRGVASSFDSNAREFNLNAPNPQCPTSSPALRVAVSDETIVARKHVESVRAIAPTDVTACLGFEAEGVRVAPDMLRAFAVTVRSQLFDGVLSARELVIDRYDLTTADGKAECVQVDTTTRIGQFFFRGMGPAFQRNTADQLFGKHVVVLGERISGGCIQAERITYVEA